MFVENKEISFRRGVIQVIVGVNLVGSLSIKVIIVIRLNSWEIETQKTFGGLLLEGFKTP
jgi:hypothetical protein